MSTLVTTNKNVTGPFAPTALTLTASDTFTYTAGSNQELLLYNTTGSSVSVTIDGAGGTTVPVPGTAATYDVSAGLVIPVPANSWKIVRLDTISAYCQGVIALTGGVGISAVLMA